MKKSFLDIAITALGAFAVVSFVGFFGVCSREALSTTRIESARYYTHENGTVVTDSGITIGYHAEVLKDALRHSDGMVMFANIDHEPENDVPVLVKISDNATPDDFSDDEVVEIGLVWNQYMDEVFARNDAFIAELQAKRK